MLFVRHAESVSGVEGTFGGPHGCRGLTAPGREQAEKLGQRLAAELRDTPPVSVYSSTLRRAIETAAVIAAALGVAPAQDCGLCTWHVPDAAAGQPKQLFQAEHALPGGGIYRPFEAGNEPGAELVSRGSRAILDALPVFRSSRRPRLGDRVGH